MTHAHCHGSTHLCREINSCTDHVETVALHTALKLDVEVRHGFTGCIDHIVALVVHISVSSDLVCFPTLAFCAAATTFASVWMRTHTPHTHTHTTAHNRTHTHTHNMHTYTLPRSSLSSTSGSGVLDSSMYVGRVTESAC